MASRSGSPKGNRPKEKRDGTEPLDDTRSSAAAANGRLRAWRPSFLEIVEATRAFIGETLDENSLRRTARIKELEARGWELERMLDGINPFCGDDTWMRQRESLERRIAEAQKAQTS